jgi:hypothetical protein
LFSGGRGELAWEGRYCDVEVEVWGRGRECEDGGVQRVVESGPRNPSRRKRGMEQRIVSKIR